MTNLHLRIKRKEKTLLLFLLPAFLVIMFIFLFPLVYNLWLSFYKMHITEPGLPFVGLANYLKIIGDRLFWIVFKTTLIFSLSSVVFQFLVGLSFALLLNQNFRGRSIFRVLLFIPWITPGVVTAVVFKWMYHPEFGIINYFLLKAGLIDHFVAWLGRSNTALPAVIFANIWKGFPFQMVLLLAGLQNIPQILYEAAIVDGANRWQRFLYITIPGLKPIIVTSTTIGFIWTMNYFDLIYVMTEGGPARITTIFPILIYKRGFTFLYFGEAAAISVLVFIIIFVLSVFYLKKVVRTRII